MEKILFTLLVLSAPAPLPRTLTTPDDIEQTIVRFDRSVQRANVLDEQARKELAGKVGRAVGRLINVGERGRFSDLPPLLEGVQPSYPLGDLPKLLGRASCEGKYRTLLYVFFAPHDQTVFNDQTHRTDYGFWHSTSYLGRSDLRLGYWVYVYPRWFVWADGPLLEIKGE